MNPWLEFFLRALQSQKQRLERKMERERVILAVLSGLSVLILELARERGGSRWPSPRGSAAPVAARSRTI